MTNQRHLALVLALTVSACSPESTPEPEPGPDAMPQPDAGPVDVVERDVLADMPFGCGFGWTGADTSLRALTGGQPAGLCLDPGGYLGVDDREVSADEAIRLDCLADRCAWRVDALVVGVRWRLRTDGILASVETSAGEVEIAVEDATYASLLAREDSRLGLVGIYQLD